MPVDAMQNRTPRLLRLFVSRIVAELLLIKQRARVSCSMNDANDLNSIAYVAEEDDVLAYRPRAKPGFQVISRRPQSRILRQHLASSF
jgi:hypothetical protein